VEFSKLNPTSTCGFPDKSMEPHPLIDPDQIKRRVGAPTSSQGPEDEEVMILSIVALALMLPDAPQADQRGVTVSQAQEFSVASQAMSVDDAAKGWLKLFDREFTEGSGRSFSSELVSAVPKPQAWPLIRAELRKRPDEPSVQIAILLFDRLLGDDRELIHACETVDSRLQGSDGNSRPGSQGRSTRTGWDQSSWSVRFPRARLKVHLTFN